MNSLSELGLEVARLRKERGMTQQQLASKCGLGQSTLARFETGGVSEFGSGKLLRLLHVLGHEISFSPVTRRIFTLEDAMAERQREVDALKAAGS